MAYDLILVGGTGQRFGLVMGWLNVLGLAEMPRKTLILDAEGVGYKSPVSERLRRLLTYAQPVRKTVKHQPPFSGDFESTPWSELDHPNSDLWRLLFTKHEEALKISRGFMANPKIAATVFAKSLLTGDETEISRFLKGGGDDPVPVLIVGSLAGGTGAGLIYSVAKACKRIIGVNPDAPIHGLLFTNYLKVEEQADEDWNARFTANSKFGADFFWDLWKTGSASKFPFDLLTMMGFPGATLAKAEKEGVHPFPGFLLGAALVADGCTGFNALVQDAANRNNPPPGICLLSVRNDRHPREQEETIFAVGEDVVFRCHARGLEIRADAFAHWFTQIRETLDDFRAFPWRDAIRGDSLYPRRKLSPAVWDSIRRASSNKKITKRAISSLFQQLVGGGDGSQHPGTIDVVLDDLLEDKTKALSFKSWFDSLKNYGFAARDDEQSLSVRPRRWKQSLRKHDFPGGGEVLMNQVLSEAWSRDALTGVLTKARGGQPAADGLAWAIPFPVTMAPQGLGLVSMAIQDAQASAQILDDNALQSSPNGESFPTPLGRVEFFKRTLRNEIRRGVVDRGEVWADTRTLWFGVALGFLEIRPHDLEHVGRGPFEKLLAFYYEAQRFVPVIYTKRRFAGIDEGMAVGGVDPDCGFWSGTTYDPEDLRIRKVLAAISEELKNDPTSETRASGVLTHWLRDLATVPRWAGHGDDAPLWVEVVRDLADDAAAAQVDRSELATTNPVTLRLSERGETVYFFPYCLEPFRAMRRAVLLAKIANGDFEIRSGVDRCSVVDKRGRVVASIAIPAIQRADTKLDPLASLLAGALKADFDGGFPLGNAGDRPSFAAALAQVATTDRLVAACVRVADEANRSELTSKARLPDLLW